MPAKVFISCGQSTESERVVARAIQDALKVRGFSPYVAVQVQSIPDLNRGIVDELRRADFYLFINFRRDRIVADAPNAIPFHRGSLYSQQELAIAYALGFQNMVFLNQRGAEKGGILGSIVSNCPEFDTADQVLDLALHAMEAAQWSPAFSRHLVVRGTRWSRLCRYADHIQWEGAEGATKNVRILVASVFNARRDTGAHQVQMRLASIVDSLGKPIDVTDSEPLKVSNQDHRYSQSIWPNAKGEFDLLALDVDRPPRVFLNSLFDVVPRKPTLAAPGDYRLTYEVLATDFPLLTFTIHFPWHGEVDPPPTVTVLPN